MTMRFLPANVDALLVELDDLAQAMALAASLAARPVRGVTEVVPAARTLLIRFAPSRLSPEALIEELSRRPRVVVATADAPLVEIEVDYRGEDLPDVAEHLGLTVAQVIERHGHAAYTVAFNGFAPGFSYLTAPDAGLNVPRRPSPRVRVPAGSVALAGDFSAVYPKESPGGWQLIGATTAVMWDLARAVPALLQPGHRVRFVDAARRRVHAVPAMVPQPVPPAAPASTPTSIEVTHAGLQALFQDAGRPGLAAQGVSASGALDQAAMRSANRLVGNDAGPAVIEAVGGGFAFASRGPTVVAVTGAEGPVVITSRDGRTRAGERHRPLALDDGDHVRLGEPTAGVRSYVAARGGFAAPTVLGSAATDTLAGIGPAALAAAQWVGIGPPPPGPVGDPDVAPPPQPRPRAEVRLDIVMGPRTDWFTADAVDRLCDQAWVVTPQSSRVGLRLAGATPLARAVTIELPSEGTLPGSLQVPPNGQPVLFLADHPLTGGYPVIAAVAPHHLDLAGQLPVGATVRFHPVRPFSVVETTTAATP